MNTIERLKQLDQRYLKDQCIFNAAEIFTNSEINEVFDSLSKLLALVDSLNKSGLMAPSVRAALEALEMVIHDC